MMTLFGCRLTALARGASCPNAMPDLIEIRVGCGSKLRFTCTRDSRAGAVSILLA
jgi:hypothetical protein